MELERQSSQKREGLVYTVPKWLVEKGKVAAVEMEQKLASCPRKISSAHGRELCLRGRILVMLEVGNFNVFLVGGAWRGESFSLSDMPWKDMYVLPSISLPKYLVEGVTRTHRCSPTPFECPTTPFEHCRRATSAARKFTSMSSFAAII